MGKKKHATAATALPTGRGRSGSISDDAEICSQGDSSLRLLVEDLRAEVGRQRQIIGVLETRLNFVLSMFGVDDVSVCANEVVPVSVADSVVVNAKATHAPSPMSSFRGAVLSAVYSDMKEQEIRSKNFIISGLPTSADNEDKTVVEALCEEELHVKPVVKSCRRLGKVIPGKVRPLKVTVRTAEQATSVIAAAKNLRKSNDEYVQRNVYINADLTKAQADAAYRARCQQRQARAARDSQPSSQQNVLRSNADEFVPSGRH